MYSFHRSILTDKKVYQYRLLEDDIELAVDDVIRLWRRSAEFRSFFNQLLADSGFLGFFFETPPVTMSTLDRVFEFVLIRSNALEKLIADPGPFSEYFHAQDTVVHFRSLGKEVVLVAPCPMEEDWKAYAHLGCFVRHAPAIQVQAFWERVGQEYHQFLSDEPTWLSTSGLGVYWLHMRIAPVPRYYQHKAYRNVDKRLR